MVAALSGEYQDWIGASFGMCTYQKNASQVDAHAHLSFVATSLGSPLVNAVALPCKLCLRPKRLITRGGEILHALPSKVRELLPGLPA